MQMSKFTQGMQKLNALFNAEKITIDAFADQVVRSKAQLIHFQSVILGATPIQEAVAMPTPSAAPAPKPVAEPAPAPSEAPAPSAMHVQNVMQTPIAQPVTNAPQQAPEEYVDEQMPNDEPPEGFEPPPPEDDEEYSYGNDDFNEESNDFEYQ